MDISCIKVILSITGVSLNLIGSLFIAFSMNKLKDEDSAWQDGEKDGEKFYFVYLVRPKLLKWGIILLLLGYIPQIIAQLI